MTLVLATSLGCSDPWDEQRARALWQEHCARCHGADGRGVAQMAVLSPRVDLFESPMVQRGPLAGRAIRSAIAEGYGTMPGFGHRLDDEELNLLTGWVAGLVERQGSTQTKEE